MGEEDLEVLIRSKSGILNFTKKPYVSIMSPTGSSDANRQSVFLSLVSKPAIR